MSERQEPETPLPDEDDRAAPGADGDLEERLQHLRTRADSSADVSSRAFSMVLGLVLVLLGLLALFALISRLLGA